MGEIVAKANWESTDAAARSAFDLVITSVLLDAGAGAGWHYHDRATGLVAGRSEGLALASLRWYETVALRTSRAASSELTLRRCARVDSEAIQNAFQARTGNPLLGLEGRASLLNRLGTVMESRPDLFAICDSPRPGGLFDALRARASNGRLPAATILETLLEALGPIWQGRRAWAACRWAIAGRILRWWRTIRRRLRTLHKLSQWLTYSLLEPLQNAGISVSNVHELTGLAEYRNGGLFVDMGVLNPRDRAALAKTHAVMDPFVVGWRALTVALLDRLSPWWPRD